MFSPTAATLPESDAPGIEDVSSSDTVTHSGIVTGPKLAFALGSAEPSQSQEPRLGLVLNCIAVLEVGAQATLFASSFASSLHCFSSLSLGG